MAELSAAPHAIRLLVRHLTRSGTPLWVQSFDSPNNQLLRAETPCGVVQVLVDRGQWLVDLAPPGSNEFCSMAVWAACLTGRKVTPELESLDAQVAWLVEFLTADVQRDVDIDWLVETRRRRAYARTGLPL